jgi:putative phosphoesterase
VLDADVLSCLAEHAPVYAVLGNNDAGLEGVLPLSMVVEIAGVRVGLVHDSGPSAGRPARLRRRFPEADVVVFGHSHIPVNEEGEGGQLLFNPGSPTQRRTQPDCTFGQLRLGGGSVIERRIIALERR